MMQLLENEVVPLSITFKHVNNDLPFKSWMKFNNSSNFGQRQMVTEKKPRARDVPVEWETHPIEIQKDSDSKSLGENQEILIMGESLPRHKGEGLAIRGESLVPINDIHSFLNLDKTLASDADALRQEVNAISSSMNG